MPDKKLENDFKSMSQAFAKLQEENEKLLKSNIEMSDLIYAEDGYVESQNVLRERLEKLKEENERLKQEVAELRDAIKECVSQLEWLNKPEPYLSTNVVLKRMYKLLGRDRV